MTNDDPNPYAPTPTAELASEASPLDGVPPREPLDEFDPARLRLNQDFGASLGIEKLITQIPVRKPDRQWWFRVHPSPDMRIQAAILELKEERETYLVDPAVCAALPNDIVAKVIVTIVNHQGAVSLWPIKLPDFSGQLDDWNKAALAAAKVAETKWVRLSSNPLTRSYDVYTTSGIPNSPAWPQLTFRELLKLTFKDRFIRTMDHPVILKLNGKF